MHAQAGQSRATRLRFSRLSDERIAVRFDFDRDIIDDLKARFPSRERTWDPDSKQWTFPHALYAQVKAWAGQHYHEAEMSLLLEVWALLAGGLASHVRLTAAVHASGNDADSVMHGCCQLIGRAHKGGIHGTPQRGGLTRAFERVEGAC